MRPFASLAMIMFPLLLTTAGAPAQPPAANQLGASDIAAGYLLLFDGSSTFGWKVAGPAVVKDGCLCIGGDREATITTNSAFHRFVVKFDYRLEGGQSARLLLGESALTLPRPSREGLTSTTFVHEPAGQAATVGFKVPAGSTLILQNVRLLPLDLKNLALNKNLEGWKATGSPRLKAQVADDGVLSLKDGPGRVQTAETWANLVLRVDVRTQGKQANGGVILRAGLTDATDGYEVQIRNQWQGEDRTRPVDFGTGGIHNRQPARKVVSSDGAWFTLTAVANGEHLAVWIDGYPVCNFTDTRAAGKTTGQGCKLDAGPIAFQIEDASAEILFRNPRVDRLPARASRSTQ